MKIIFLISGLLILSSNYIKAQSTVTSCGVIENANQTAELKLKNSLTIPEGNHKLNNDRAITDTIHVVVHVLWSTAAMNIPDSMIHKQLKKLNEDFQRTNADAVNTPSPFAAIAGSLPVHFALAYKDTNGNPTTGIIRIQTTHGPFGFNTYFDMTHNANGGDRPWNSHFMNMYCAEMSGSDGVGWMGSNLCLIANTSFGVNRTGTHEMGHVFGLSHIWGPEQSTGPYVCSGDDGIADTPEQWSPAYYCGPFPLTDSCTTTGNGVMYMNYMNYNSDACVNMFSQGQVDLMRETLNGVSNDLINGNPLSAHNFSSPENISIYPNPSHGNIQIVLQENTLCDVTIYDATGRQHFVLHNASGTNKIYFPAAQGIYFCAVKGKDINVIRKLVVE